MTQPAFRAVLLRHSHRRHRTFRPRACRHCKTPAHTLYWRELCRKRYTCARCERRRPWCDGAGDEYLSLCDECFCAVGGGEDDPEYTAAMQQLDRLGVPR